MLPIVHYFPRLMVVEEENDSNWFFYFKNLYKKITRIKSNNYYTKHYNLFKIVRFLIFIKIKLKYNLSLYF